MIPLNDLKRQYQTISEEVEKTVQRVLKSGWYILGPEVDSFENEFAAYCQTKYCIGLANGTEALEISLRSLDIGIGDEVITVANAGMYSTSAIRAVGAHPVFAEVIPGLLTIDPSIIPGLVTPRTKAVIVTHLYGRMVDMPTICLVARRFNLAVIEDCAQSHGAILTGKAAGSWGDLGCFSFYPTKNLGALGDAGAIVTSNAQLADRARKLRQYGWDRKYHNVLSGGRNSRLDEIQAAVLRVKLPYLDGWNHARRQVASWYYEQLAGTAIQLPPLSKQLEMVFHLYVMQTPDRKSLIKHLQKNAIGYDIHYPLPDHLQPACQDLGGKPGMLPVTERASQQITSLPCFPELAANEVQQVCQVIRQAGKL